MAPINGKITFGSLVYLHGKGAISTHVKVVFDVQEDFEGADKAFIISINDHKLSEPIELIADEVTTPGKYRWSTRKGGVISWGVPGIVYLHSAELIEENGTQVTSSSAESQAGDDNRWSTDNLWYADATVTFGNDGQQTFRDIPIIAE